MDKTRAKLIGQIWLDSGVEELYHSIFLWKANRLDYTLFELEDGTFVFAGM